MELDFPANDGRRRITEIERGQVGGRENDFKIRLTNKLQGFKVHDDNNFCFVVLVAVSFGQNI